MAPFPLPSLQPFFSHLTHETYVQTIVNHSTRCIFNAKTHFGAFESQEDYFDGLSFIIISSVESHFTNDPAIDTTPTVWEPRKLEGIIGYVMFTTCTQKDLT
jgi:hypothetical protein